MKLIPALGLALAVASPLAAQDFADRYEVIGTLDMTLGGESQTLYALRDTERERTYIDTREAAGFTIMTISAVAEGEDGGLDRPYASLALTLENGAPADGGISVVVTTEEAELMANQDSGQEARVDSLTMGEDGAIELSFSGTLLPMETDADYNATPVEGGEPVEVSGSFSGQVPQ